MLDPIIEFMSTNQNIYGTDLIKLNGKNMNNKIKSLSNWTKPIVQ